jgi:hypothetical protein
MSDEDENEYEDESEYEDEDENEDEEDFNPFEEDENEPLDVLQPQLNLDLQDYSLEEHVVPDRVASLENYINILSESISRGTITQTEFDSEILKTNYYLDMLTKKHNIMTEEKQKIIEDARILRKEAIEAYKLGAISEERFNEVYTNAIRTEYSILKSSEIETDDLSEQPVADFEEDLTFLEKLEKLEKMEEKQIKKVAKKHGVKFPAIPNGKTASAVDKYYDLKITGRLKKEDIDPVIETYISKYSDAKKIVDYHTTSFEVTKIFYDSKLGRPSFEFKLVPSIRGDIEKIKRTEDINQLLNPQETATVERLNELKSMLRQMSKLQLIKCADIQLFELLTYIEKLRANKQYAFKFKTTPDALDIEAQLLSDNELYKLPPGSILTEYKYSRPNIYNVQEDSSVIELNEVGNIGYLALKANKNPLKTINDDPDDDTDLNMDDYDTIVPFQDNLYSELNSKEATYTEIVEIWEIHSEFINGSKKTLRYTSFEDFLLVFKRLLIKISKDLKKIEDEQLSEKLTNRSELKYPRLKPRTAPFLLGQKTETKSFEELRYDYYNKPDVPDVPDKFKIELSEPIRLKKAATDNLEEESNIKILLNKIMQIEYFLIFKMDKIKTSATAQLSSRQLIDNESEVIKMREYGLEKLINYISLTDPGAEELIKHIEEDIFNFSSENYQFNIKKVIFIFDNFPEKLEDILLSRQSSVKELLLYETPNNTVQENTFEIKTDEDKNKKIKELIEWKPNTSLYDTYKEELSLSSHDFKAFKNAHPELKNIEIGQIMSEYVEKIQWEKSIISYTKLEVPSGMIELNFRLRFLLRQRNRLASRRIFKLSTISNRIDRQEDLERTFGTCKVKNYKKMSLHTERIIYSLSKTPEDYMYYNYIINSKFKLICESLILLEQSKLINEYDFISIIIKFILNNGDFTEEDIEIINKFTGKITPENIELYISSLENRELQAQNSYRVSKKDAGEKTDEAQESYSDAANVAESERARILQDELIYESNNKFVPPAIYTTKPDDYADDKYFVINGQYIRGGFYPPFLRWNENLVSTQNYKRVDLLKLADLFALKYLSTDTDYNIYEKIKKFIDDKKSTPLTEVNLNRIRFDAEISEPKYDYLKIPLKTIIYTFRSQYLVPEPGVAYNVILDKTNSYGVPFRFENGIPVYSSKLKELVDNRFIIIEGPSIYEDTLDINSLRSNYYILIEYIDSRGVKILFKEGVAEKKIIKKIPGYSACDRFKNREACDNPNSYSLEIKGKRYKCKWENTCVIFDDTKIFEDFEAFNISKVSFLEKYKQENWANALEKSLKYIEDKIVSEKMSPENIDILKLDQRKKLFNYYKRLFEYEFSKEIGVTKIADKTEVVHDKSLLSEFKDDILKPSYAPGKKKMEDIQEGYVRFTIYKHKKTESVKSIDKVILNNTYNTYKDGTFVTIKPYAYSGSTNSYSCLLDDNSTIEVSKNEIYKVNGDTLKVIPIFCIVSKEDLPFLTKRKGYYWIHKETQSIRRYDEKGEPEILSKDTLVERFDVPTNFIEPTSNLPGLPIITRDNIFEAMYKTAFDTLSNSVNPLIYSTIVSFNATKGAKKFAVINRIDLTKIIKIGTIGIEDIQILPDVNYTINTITPQQVFDILSDAISKNDIDTISKYYLVGVKAEIDGEILKSAKQIIDSYKKSGLEEIQNELESVTPVIVAEKPAVSYVIQRGGKKREEVEE